MVELVSYQYKYVDFQPNSLDFSGKSYPNIPWQMESSSFNSLEGSVE